MNQTIESRLKLMREKGKWPNEHIIPEPNPDECPQCRARGEISLLIKEKWVEYCTACTYKKGKFDARFCPSCNEFRRFDKSTGAYVCRLCGFGEPPRREW